DRVEKQPPASRPAALRDAAAGKLAGPELARAAEQLQQALSVAKKKETEPRDKQSLAGAPLPPLPADDPHPPTHRAAKAPLWPNRPSRSADAAPPAAGVGPEKASTTIDGHKKTVLRFDGKALLEAPGQVPPEGSLFVVYQVADTGKPGQRLVGWED